MKVVDLINHKRLNQELSKEALDYLVRGFLQDEIKDYQVSALLMAICINGMTVEETINLTKAMLKHSLILDLSSLNAVDKHSTGGVGDKTTLIVVPLVASCGVIVPKMSGRGLGYTGGTSDKLEAIPGMQVHLTKAEIKEQLKQLGAVLMTTNPELVPADSKLYALRDVTGTVSSLPLIAASIMSKKIAAGTTKIVIDLKVGKGALIQTKEETKLLVKLMMAIANHFQKKLTIVISRMDSPLGSYLGHGLEVIEALKVLKGDLNNDLGLLSITIASEMVSLGLGLDLNQARELVLAKLNSGAALAKFKAIITAQKGDLNHIIVAPQVVMLKAPGTGYITKIDALIMARFCQTIGGGRLTSEDQIDHGVGIVLTKQINDYVKTGEVIAKVYTRNLKLDLDPLKKAYSINEKPIKKESIIIDIIYS